MQSYQIYKNLARINELPFNEAEAGFLDCCGSQAWARQMAAARPFRMVEELYQKAGTIWLSLRVADWIEAFAAHPKIGSRKKTTSHQAKSAGWSKDEQAGVDTASDDTRDALDEANHLYEDKFGFIFIVCATGKSPDEMLAHCVSRIANDRAREISIAAEEQRKIMEIRLGKLLEQ